MKRASSSDRQSAWADADDAKVLIKPVDGISSGSNKRNCLPPKNCKKRMKNVIGMGAARNSMQINERRQYGQEALCAPSFIFKFYLEHFKKHCLSLL
ncbi:unnamed protein product [Gongylonema pulchrum]|uniref:Uncharacterized protein n=1 Tax=Gongylonema pulchrum TaxID=637853 RepID=A0A183EAI9_9BILA|nr:unnamed protein product [Gongylonema pulchrum]